MNDIPMTAGELLIALANAKPEDAYAITEQALRFAYNRGYSNGYEAGEADGYDQAKAGF